MSRLSTLALPLAVTPAGALAPVLARDRVIQGVMLYFFTPRGSRCMVPEFGYPPLWFYEGNLPLWVTDVQNGLCLIQHVTAATLNVSLEDGIVHGNATVQTDAGEEVEYDFTINAA